MVRKRSGTAWNKKYKHECKLERKYCENPYGCCEKCEKRNMCDNGAKCFNSTKLCRVYIGDKEV